MRFTPRANNRCSSRRTDRPLAERDYEFETPGEEKQRKAGNDMLVLTLHYTIETVAARDL